MKPSDSKINALKNAEQPQDRKGTRSYSGMVNYLKDFIPDFSTLKYPLRQLTHKHTKFVWTDACEKSFNILNHMLTDAAINTCFDKQKETILYCDASPFGLSSILLQNDNKDHLQVISYSSRSLNTTEQRYSQLERECLSIAYACQRHRDYLFGKTFKIYSDNKAIVDLLSRPCSKVPLQIERMILQLQGYDFDIKYVKTEQNISHYISRHTNRKQKLIESTEVDKDVDFVTSTAAPKSITLEDIATATKQDKVLQILKQTILNNEWKSMDKKQYDLETLNLLKQYKKLKELLKVYIQYDIILKDNRIVNS